MNGRFLGTLVLSEHQNGQLSPVTLNTISAASQFDQDVTCLVAGKDIDGVVEQVKTVTGVKTVLVANDAKFHGLLPGMIGRLIVQVQQDKKQT